MYTVEKRSTVNYCTLMRQLKSYLRTYIACLGQPAIRVHEMLTQQSLTCAEHPMHFPMYYRAAVQSHALQIKNLIVFLMCMITHGCHVIILNFNIHTTVTH